MFILISLMMIYLQPNLACYNSNKFLGFKILSNQDQQMLLDAHNELRNQVAAGKVKGQPPAENMLELTWNDFAASQARDWAMQCIFEHNKPVDQNNERMGQNLAIKMTTFDMHGVDKSFEKYAKYLIEQWFDEVRHYHYGTHYISGTGHYTQMVWAESASVGCGYTYYLQWEDVREWYTGYLACNYSPAGNYVGEKPYQVGRRNCEKYGWVPSKRYSHLCVKK